MPLKLLATTEFRRAVHSEQMTKDDKTLENNENGMGKKSTKLGMPARKTRKLRYKVTVTHALETFVDTFGAILFVHLPNKIQLNQCH